MGHLLLGHFRITRQCQNLRGQQFCARQGSDNLARQNGLQMVRNRIVDICCNAALVQVRRQGFPCLDAHDEQMHHMILTKLCRHLHPRILQTTFIAVAPMTSARVVRVQVGQKNPQNRGLQFIQATVSTSWTGHLIFLGPAILAQLAQSQLGFRITANHGTAIAQRTQILGGIKTEASDIAKCPDPASGNFGAMRLCTVLDQGHAAIGTKLGHQINTRYRPTIQVSDNNRPDTGLQRCIDFSH